jgi:transposase
MLGEQTREEPLFYFLRVDELIPPDHILRLIDRYVDFAFIRPTVKPLYSHTGRPSIDPEVMLRMLLVGYLFGITSERRLCDEVQMHLGYRWFVGLSLHDPVPDHSTFSKNRHGRFKESGIYQELFDEIVRQCLTHGLVSGTHLTVDSTLVKAHASFRTLEPIVVALHPKEYLDQVERENPVAAEEDPTADEPWEPPGDWPHRGQRVSNETHRSRVDPDARITRKSNFSETYLGYGVSYLMDNRRQVILGAAQNLPNRHADAETALTLTQRTRWVFHLAPETLGADKGYATGEFVHRLLQEAHVLPHLPIMNTRRTHDGGIYPITRFRYEPDGNRFLCPQGKPLRYWGVHPHSKQHVYRASATDCRSCPVKAECTRSTYRSVSVHIYEAALARARALTKTPGYRMSQRMRKRVEELFGEAKEFMGLRRAKFRRALHVQEQVLLTATAQNIKRMVKWLSLRGPQREVEELVAVKAGIVERLTVVLQWARSVSGPQLQLLLGTP